MSLNNFYDRFFADIGKYLNFMLATGVCLLPATVNADEVYLKDGSRLVGEIQQMSDNNLVMNTGFAKGLEINPATVKGITADNALMVTLATGDRLSGVLNYSETTGQRLLQTTFGDIDLRGKSAIAGVWEKGQQNPEYIAETKEHSRNVAELEEKHQTEISEVKESYEDELKEVRLAKAKLEDPWSGSIGLGLAGQSGNTENFGVQGRGEAKRDTGFDRILLYVEGNLEEQNEQTTVNEVFAGATLEHDLNDRWFVFGSADFEKDEFENLDLRGVAQTGAGYFFIREPKLTFKGLAGLGYQHESFTDGTTVEEGVVSLGYDFLYEYNDWWEIGHKVTYFPSLNSPSSDYRLVSNAFTEVPLMKDEAWKVRLSVRNQYDNVPRPGIKKLDTSYLVNLVYDWE